MLSNIPKSIHKPKTPNMTWPSPPWQKTTCIPLWDPSFPFLCSITCTLDLLHVSINVFASLNMHFLSWKPSPFCRSVPGRLSLLSYIYHPIKKQRSLQLYCVENAHIKINIHSPVTWGLESLGVGLHLGDVDHLQSNWQPLNQWRKKN